MDPIESLLEQFPEFEVRKPWRWPGNRPRLFAEWVCGQLDGLPSVGKNEDGWGVYRHGGWGCRLALWRVWSTAPVIRQR